MARRPEVWLELAERLGVTVAPAARTALNEFCALLLSWNVRINLTGARTPEELQDEHLVDAVVMAALISPGARLVDVGSGGGLPAIPFGVLRPDVRLTLVEPRAKRVAFLRTAVRATSLMAEVVAGRVEDVTAGGKFDVAASRATFAPPEWLGVARRLAPDAVVFAARRGEVGSVAGGAVTREIAYQTGRGHPRWAGVLRFT